MTVHKKLMNVRIALHAMPLKKSGENKFANYRYFELGDFLPQTLKLFHEQDMCGVVSFEVDKATLTITDLEDGTTVIIGSPMAEAALKGAHAIQNMGAVHTYMRRYLWMLATELAENDYLDGGSAPAKSTDSPPANARPPEPPKSPPRPPQKIEGGPGAWQLKVTLQPGGDVKEWLKVIEDACNVALEMTKSQADVMEIFKKNKALFEEAKKQDAEFFKGLMATFAKVKGKFPKEEA